MRVKRFAKVKLRYRKDKMEKEFNLIKNTFLFSSSYSNDSLRSTLSSNSYGNTPTNYNKMFWLCFTLSKSYHNNTEKSYLNNFRLRTVEVQKR